MIRLRVTTHVSALAFGLAIAVAASAWAGAPGYYCTEQVGLSNTYPASVTNAYGETLLPNGTVIGETVYQPYPLQLPSDYLVSWSNSGPMSTWGTMTTICTGTTVQGVGSSLLSIANCFGDASGQLAVNNTTYLVGGPTTGINVYSGGTLSAISQSAMEGSSVNLVGMSQNGLIAGWSGSTAFAYDTATSAYYPIGPANSWTQGVNGTYVVGGDGTNYDGFVWNETNQSYGQIAGLAAAQGISSNAQLVAGLNQNSTSQAAVYALSQGTYSLKGTYWNGEAVGVNNNGVVIGDTASSFYLMGDSTDWQGDAMAYFPGWNDPQGVDLNTYAPAGVKFNAAEAVNDAGQILVWSGGYDQQPTDGPYVCKSYLLTPAVPGDANLDGKVDINDLTIVLSHYNQTGMSWGTGDFVGDGTVDINDLTIVLSHYNQTAGAAAAGIAAVPEPGRPGLIGSRIGRSNGLDRAEALVGRWRPYYTLHGLKWYEPWRQGNGLAISAAQSIHRGWVERGRAEAICARQTVARYAALGPAAFFRSDDFHGDKRMLKLVSIPKGFALAFGLAMAAAQVAWAGAPGYYVTDLVGLSAYGPPTPTNAYGETLLSNGTVIGETIYQIVPDSLVSWANSGAMSDLGNHDPDLYRERRHRPDGGY